MHIRTEDGQEQLVELDMKKPDSPSIFDHHTEAFSHARLKTPDSSKKLLNLFLHTTNYRSNSRLYNQARAKQLK